MTVVFINYTYASDLSSPSQLVRRFHPVHEWCRAVLRAGATSVHVVQRFSETTRMRKENVEYHFVDDGMGSELKPWVDPLTVHRTALSLEPDVIHLNGDVQFAPTLRRLLQWRVPIVWQSHTDGLPRMTLRPWWKRALGAVDGVFVTSSHQCEPWREFGLMNGQLHVYQVPVASSGFRLLDHRSSKKKLGMAGQTVFLWVARLTPKKDPLTVIEGFRTVADRCENAHLYMVYSSCDLLSSVKIAVSRFSLADRVHLVGFVEHESLSCYYSAADFFVMGSHGEVCGFALLEALSCGATPVVTDIPSFRELTADGSVGFLWKAGNPESFVRAALHALRQQPDRKTVRAYFLKYLSYEVLGRKALESYSHAFKCRQLATSVSRREGKR